MIRGLALGALLAGMIACAAGRMSAAPATTSGSQPPVAPVMAGDPHAQIEALERDITARGGKFEPVATMATAAIPMTAAPTSADATCHPAATPSCGDVCKLSDSICDDAKKICDIAVTLANDTWAAGKCESGKQSCSDAHANCCSCR
jgi:hypothetical protein